MDDLKTLPVTVSFAQGQFFFCGNSTHQKVSNFIRSSTFQLQRPVLKLITLNMDYGDDHKEHGRCLTVRQSPTADSFDFQHSVSRYSSSLIFPLKPDLDLSKPFYVFSWNPGPIIPPSRWTPSKIWMSRSPPIMLNTCLTDFALNNNECAICLDTLDMKIDNLLSCGHWFHVACLALYNKSQHVKCSSCDYRSNSPMYKESGYSLTQPEHYMLMKCPICRQNSV